MRNKENETKVKKNSISRSVLFIETKTTETGTTKSPPGNLPLTFFLLPVLLQGEARLPRGGPLI